MTGIKLVRAERSLSRPTLACEYPGRVGPFDPVERGHLVQTAGLEPPSSHAFAGLAVHHHRHIKRLADHEGLWAQGRYTYSFGPSVHYPQGVSG
jgi:hypothetical protein